MGLNVLKVNVVVEVEVLKHNWKCCMKLSKGGKKASKLKKHGFLTWFLVSKHFKSKHH